MAVKKTAKKNTKTTAKKSAATAKKKPGGIPEKYSFIDEVHEAVLDLVEVTSKGEPRLKKNELKKALEEVFERASVAAANGQRVRFPVIGALVRTDVKARKAGKGVNPFTGEEIQIKARPANKKPRWSFPKAVKDIFATKKYW